MFNCLIQSSIVLAVWVTRCYGWQLFGFYGNVGRRHAVMVVVIATMSFQGIANVQHQRSIRTEFTNPSLEGLIRWINGSTTPG